MLKLLESNDIFGKHKFSAEVINEIYRLWTDNEKSSLVETIKKLKDTLESENSQIQKICSSEYIIMDRTFESCPNHYVQLYVIHIIESISRIFYSVFYAIFLQKDEETYNVMLRYFKSIVGFAMISALTEILNESYVKICLWHYRRASQYAVNSVQNISTGITSILYLSGRSLSKREKELLQHALRNCLKHYLDLGEFLKSVKLFPDIQDIMFYAQKTVTLLMIVSFTTSFQFCIDNFPEESSLCPIETLKKYITLSEERRVEDSFFVTIKEPNKRVITTTLQR
uniref:Odorant receptor n=1 Tax=Strongyloides venezuelensis TaxID=75913 RepID=A0A0K0EUR8_STRVS